MSFLYFRDFKSEIIIMLERLVKIRNVLPTERMKQSVHIKGRPASSTHSPITSFLTTI